jgi:hypothetical protein
MKYMIYPTAKQNNSMSEIATPYISDGVPASSLLCRIKHLFDKYDILYTVQSDGEKDTFFVDYITYASAVLEYGDIDMVDGVYRGLSEINQFYENEKDNIYCHGYITNTPAGNV